MCHVGVRLFNEWTMRNHAREAEIAKAHQWYPYHDWSGDAIEFKSLIDSAKAAEREFGPHFRFWIDCSEAK